MKTEITIDVTGEINLEYDPSSPEFKESLQGYRDVIDKDGTMEDMLKHVAFHITRFGIESMVEGVGFVGYNGVKPAGTPYSGIIVGEDYDEFDFSI